MKNALASALLAAVLLLPPGAAAAADGFKVVVNADQKTFALSKEELSRVFLKKSTRWLDGSEIRVVQPRMDSAVRRAFDPAIHGMPPAAVRAYWSQMVFSGRDVPPVEKANDDAVLEFVRENAGAIGVVSAGAATSGVKVLEVR